MKKYALVSDFDGTISGDDFFTHLSEVFFDDEMLAPWRRYLEGKETHFNALNAMFSQVHLPEDEFKKFIKTIHYDKKFFKAAELCVEKGIPVYICSAGCSYYIDILIGAEIKKYGIKLITNKGIYNPKDGLKMIAPKKSSPYYNEKVGISKKSIVKELKEKGYKVIFAGDGPPDFEPAQIADFVFAKKILLQKCLEAGVKTLGFKDFENVYNFVKDL